MYNNNHRIVYNWRKLETTQISISNSVDIKMDAYATLLITSLHTQLPKSCQGFNLPLNIALPKFSHYVPYESTP